MSIFTSKKFLIVAGIVLSLFIGIAIGRNSKPSSPAAIGNPALNIVKEIISGNKTDSDLVKVVRIIDGDTIEIEGGERIRYIGIDTPETIDPRKPVQC